MTMKVNGQSRDQILRFLVEKMTEQEATDMISAADADRGKWKPWGKAKIRRDGVYYSAEI